VPRTARTLFLCTVLALGTAACSSGSESPEPAAATSRPSLPVVASGAPEVPAGFTTYEGDGYSFAYPEDWELVERQGDDGPVVVAEGPVTPAGLPQQFIVATQEQYAGDLDLVVNAFEFTRQLPDQEVVRDERVQTGGGVEAQLTERTHTAPTPGGPVRSRVLELRLVTPDQLLLLTSARTSDEHFDDSPLQTIHDSLRLTP
jgi:hypothetical protein